MPSHLDLIQRNVLAENRTEMLVDKNNVLMHVSVRNWQQPCAKKRHRYITLKVLVVYLKTAKFMLELKKALTHSGTASSVIMALSCISIFGKRVSVSKCVVTFALLKRH